MKITSLTLTSLVALPLVLSVLSADVSGRRHHLGKRHGHKNRVKNVHKMKKKHRHHKKGKKHQHHKNGKKHQHHKNKHGAKSSTHQKRKMKKFHHQDTKNAAAPISSASSLSAILPSAGQGVGLQSLFAAPSASNQQCPPRECDNPGDFPTSCYENVANQYCAYVGNGQCMMRTCQYGMVSRNNLAYNRCKPDEITIQPTSQDSCPAPPNKASGVPRIFFDYPNQVNPHIDMTCVAACVNNRAPPGQFTPISEVPVNLNVCMNKDLKNTCFCDGTNIALLNQKDSCGFYKVYQGSRGSQGW